MATQAPPDVTKRNPAFGQGSVFEAVVGPEPRSKEGFEPIPAMPHVDSGAGEYTPLSAKQFEGANLAEGQGRIGFRRTLALGDESRITVTHSGIAFGRKTGEGMTSSSSARGGRQNVQLPGGYYFRRSVST